MMDLHVAATVRMDVEPLGLPSAPLRPVLYQVKHDKELGEVRNVTLSNGAPEIFRTEPHHMTRFTESWQRLSFAMNPNMTPAKWTALYGGTTVITNEQGFGQQDDRRNYINNTNLTAEYPKVASLLFGGNVVTGTVEGEWLWVETFNAAFQAPTLEYIMARRWLWQIGTNVRKDGSVGRLPQGNGADVLLPIYASQAVKFPLAKLRRLRDDENIPSVYL